MDLKVLCPLFLILSLGLGASIKEEGEVALLQDAEVKDEVVKDLDPAVGDQVEEVEEVEDTDDAPRAGGHEYSIDRTADLFGLVAYFEYLYYPGEWIVPWNYGLPHYTGCINTISESFVFDPYEKAHMIFHDCGDGYACIESEYRDYYFGLAEIDYSANFYYASSLPTTDDASKFKIFCADTGLYSFDRCNIVAYAYGGEYKVYSTSGEFLKYCESCGSNDWFRWRIKADRPTDMTAIESESACNTGSNSITEVFSHDIGIDNARTWDFEQIISLEVKMAMEYAATNNMLTQNENWLFVVSDKSYDEIRRVTDSTSTTIPPNRKVVFYQLRGNYGPYTVYSDYLNPAVVSC